MHKERNVEQEVQALLADEQYAGHPLRQGLADLYQEYQDQLRQIERVTRISDHYQSAARNTSLSLAERCRRQLRHLEKVVRISDGYQSLMRDRQTSLQEESLRDLLTGLGNRRFLQNQLNMEASRLENLQRPLTLVMADVDHFKMINDTYGHDVGDKVLVAMARVLEQGLRDYDICGRWGGEEFVIIMPELDASVAYNIIERLRQSIMALEICVDEQLVGISVSFGIAQRRAQEEIKQTLERADQALLSAKRAGRNRCEIAA